MQTIILKDKTKISVEDGGSIDRLVKYITDYSELDALYESLTVSNLSHFNFVVYDKEEEVITGEYDNKVLKNPAFEVTPLEDQRIEVVFGFRDYTQEEVQKNDMAVAISYLSNEEALSVKNLYPEWEKDKDGYGYDINNPCDLRRLYDGRLWKLQKSHNKQSDWYPGADPTLWMEIVEGHDGTLEDPIPVPDSVTTSGFEYEYGKYYLEGEDIYIAKREGKSDGEKEILYYKPSQLVDQYFEKVK